MSRASNDVFIVSQYQPTSQQSSQSHPVQIQSSHLPPTSASPSTILKLIAMIYPSFSSLQIEINAKANHFGNKLSFRNHQFSFRTSNITLEDVHYKNFYFIKLYPVNEGINIVDSRKLSKGKVAIDFTSPESLHKFEEKLPLHPNSPTNHHVL
ncbi:hypothetical protein DERF_000843 [Dermatophagoides farinae]|uniref:Uncharacterized protein n=1 Tax=Dermatophagoides farinae TaxID=6954 RepID=A0A922L836_DERFA|nr:hypothetical protein DERF_000843 [Dermatophagoides farinae]